MQKIITGFHAVEERVRRAKEENSAGGIRIFYSKPGPRVKKILSAAEDAGIPCSVSDDAALDKLTEHLSAGARDHRGIVLCVENEKNAAENRVDFDQWVSEYAAVSDDVRVTVLVLDSVTDPHNVGAVIRSCDQFGAALIVLPESRGTNDVAGDEVIARTSAGASAWVPSAVVPNLVRAVQRLKEAGFWVYGADAGGTHADKINFPQKSVIIMGSEGTGIARLLSQQCDEIVSIPTCGKIDSLNVSVAAGVLLYELYRRTQK
ncbi:MAG: 23S rRNA (guanosine(2251)-2'-O)-methyltransferase RlmB [Treponema sp.]|nr:23S rRNA (guanosine(2251)-2'-O)-methyltransferase RlmB [Treponema sp.]